MLEPGVHVGPYEIVALIGAGAMGEVYRARDPRLGRDVAIKVLPASLAADGERLRRFETEARAAAALNHPNILAVYDIGQHEGVPYIVSELLEGRNLREHLTEVGALPVRRAVDYAVQITNGLAAAHDRKIVHRDLKPENIFITTDDRVKILDFGLAKLIKPEPEAPDGNAPTAAGTQPGVLLGTVGYMSPEQVRGMATDYRSDLFSLGAILHEMLSGFRAFQRETVADTITAILKDHPAELGTLGTLDRRIPSLLARIVERCLEKSPAARFHSTQDLAFALASSLQLDSDAGTLVGSGPAAIAAPTRGLRWAVAAAALLLATIGLVGAMLLRNPEVPQEVVRLTVPPPKDVGPVALTLRLSPDGSRLLFPATTTTDGVRRLWVRPLNMLDAFAIAGTEDATYPFWAPDGRSIGFFADGKLKRIDPVNGVATPLCDAAQEAGGTWSADGTILFSSGGRLHRVSANGGTPVALELTDDGRPRTTLAHPLFLPDGRHFLYLDAGTGAVGEPALYAGLLDADGRLTTDRTLIVHADSGAAYSQGYLFYQRGSTLVAQAFDVTRMALSGDPVPIVDQIQTAQAPPGGAFTVSDRVLAYRTGIAARGISSQLTWFDRSGKPAGTVGEPADYGDVEISPSGSRVAVSVLDPPDGRDIQIFDLARGLPTRFTSDRTDDLAAVWSPDESRIVFSSRRKGHLDLYAKASSGAGAEEPIEVDSFDKFPLGWSPDNKYLLFSTGSVTQVGNQGDLWVRAWSDGKKTPLLQTEYSEFPGRFSPDGRWIAYRSNESGRSEVYVVSFPALDRKVRISTTGGNLPRWRRDGQEIFYLAPDNTMTAVPVTIRANDVSVGAAQALFDVRPRGGQRYSYDVSRDGQRFLVAVLTEQPAVAPLTIVINWQAELTK
ncbi:MAG: protein kinase [Vicinamibacterales bacterium]